MKRFIQEDARTQMTLLPACLEDYVGEDNPEVRVAGRATQTLHRGTTRLP